MLKIAVLKKTEKRELFSLLR